MAQAPDRLPRLPTPLIPMSSAVVLADPACGREPECNRMVGHFARAPVVRGIGHLDMPARRGIHVDDVHTSAVARDHAAARECIDCARADVGILGEYAIGIAPDLDEIVLGLAL